MTDAGLDHAERTGKALGDDATGALTVLYGGTRRTRETAEALIRGIDDAARVQGPRDSFALRNPDMYLAGTRVNMVSSAAALAEQVPGMTEELVQENTWWTSFFTSADRIGWWLSQQQPPGESAADLARRILRFAESLADRGPTQDRVVIGVTHSPLLRAVLLDVTGADPGEPGYVTGVDVRIAPAGQMQISPYHPLGL